MSQYRGSPLGIRFTIALYNIFGYSAAKFVVFIVALFYAAVSQSKRKELSSYYNAVGLPDNLVTYFRHIYAFALNIFDRFIAKEGMQDSVIKTEIVNAEAFEKLHGSGGIMILSHHGNWAQSFKIFHSYDIRLNIIGDEAIDENLQKIESDPQGNRRINIISLKNGMQAMVEIAKALQNREVVIIMVDRVKKSDKSVEVDFLNRPTLLHSGGFEIAYIRRSPMIGCDIVRTGDQQIKVLFSDLILSAHQDKEGVIRDLAQQYAHFLEKPVREYPLQWFNFFDFWENKR